MRKPVALLSESPAKPDERRGLGPAILALGLALAACGMPTSFKGEAKVPGGRVGCEEKCRLLGMELAGMVVMGEYSDGCICAVPNRPSTAEARALLMVGASGVVAPAAGVRMQMDDEEDDARRRHGARW